MLVLTAVCCWLLYPLKIFKPQSVTENEITILDCNTLSLGDDSVSANMFTSLLPSSSDNGMNYLGCYIL